MSEYYGVSTPSSDFLAHYGVKGMKWGVRKIVNDFSSNYRKLHNANQVKRGYKIFKRGDGPNVLENTEAYKKLASSTKKELGDLKKAEDAVTNFQSAFYKNKKLVDKHRRILSKQYANKYGYTEQDYYNHMKNGDFDQGESFDHYLKTNPKQQLKYKKLINNQIAASRAYDNKASSSIDASVGKYQNKKVNTKYNSVSWSNGKRYYPTVGSIMRQHNRFG